MQRIAVNIGMILGVWACTAANVRAGDVTNIGVTNRAEEIVGAVLNSTPPEISVPADSTALGTEPVSAPEPSSLALLAGGLGIVAAARRRKRWFR